MRAICLLGIIAFTSCSVMRGSQSNAQAAGNTISFLVFNIHKDTRETAPTITLLSRQESAGTIKKQPEINGPAYLTLYIYSNRHMVDSVRVDHPLYKHLEYPGDDHQFISKDTLITNADFFVRFQTEEPADEIRITETIASGEVRKLSTIKL